MRYNFSLSAVLFGAGLLAIFGGAARVAADPTTLTIHADQPGIKISPDLYGVFFEEINHAGDGGLYAELIRNRDFQEPLAKGNDLATAWTKRESGGAHGSVDFTRAIYDDAPAFPPLDIHCGVVPKGGRVAAVNEGFWGIPARKGAAYDFSVYGVCGSDFSGNVTVSLEGAKGEIYAQSVVKGLSGRESDWSKKWRRFTARLVSKATDPKARLVIAGDAPGHIWIALPSLFPENTYKGRKNGLRPDLAEKVGAIKPAFVRFPGGCYVEGGDKLADRFQWKNTLGDISQRPGHLNSIWNYRSTDGLGYHEYLQWCEDLGAEPLFVANCGISHKEQIPMNEIGAWVQDAMDAIEYANGPATSKWGAVRAKNGHPAPFHLKYVEIGNENNFQMAAYIQRYKPFYDAIKTKYPDIITIANGRVPHPMEVVDDHYYSSPTWFWANTRLYDKGDRTGPKVYVGEYAVTQDCGKGNLKAGLAEAAFMTGLERNSDLVTMSSYAPLFVNVNDRNWNPDAIVFDASRSYGTPSYWVQKLFAANRPDILLPTEYTAPPVTLPVTKGSIGLGTWNTQAEFKDIEVTQDGKTLYRSDFSQEAADWKPRTGDWKTVDGAYRQAAGGENRTTLLANDALNAQSDYTLRLKARKLGGAEGFLIMFRSPDDDHWIWWNVGGWNNSGHQIQKNDGGAKMDIGDRLPGKVETGRWYDVRVEAAANRFRCYLDDKLAQETTDQGAESLAAIAGRSDQTGDIIVKVVNGSDNALPATLDLRGAGALQSSGQAITLTSGGMNDENTLDDPLKIAPKTEKVGNISPKFSYTFPARSLTILRLKAKKLAAK